MHTLLSCLFSPVTAWWRIGGPFKKSDPQMAQMTRMGERPETAGTIRFDEVRIEGAPVEIFRIGDYGEKGKYSEADLDEIVENFRRRAGGVIPQITIGHDDGASIGGEPGPFGVIEALERKGGSLWATFGKVAKALRRWLADRPYAQRSVEFYPEGKFGAGLVLRGVSFVVQPEVKGMAPLPVFRDSRGEYFAVGMRPDEPGGKQASREQSGGKPPQSKIEEEREMLKELKEKVEALLKKFGEGPVDQRRAEIEAEIKELQGQIAKFKEPDPEKQFSQADVDAAVKKAAEADAMKFSQAQVDRMLAEAKSAKAGGDPEADKRYAEALERIQTLERERRADELKHFLEGLVREGMPPALARAKGLREFYLSLCEQREAIEFGEGPDVQKRDAAVWFREFLGAAQGLVKFDGKSAGDLSPDERAGNEDEVLTRKAEEYQEKHPGTLFSDALAAVARMG